MSDCVTEGLANLVASSWRTFVVCLSAAVLLGFAAVMDGSAVGRLVEREAVFIESGGNIVVVDAENSDISWAACVELQEAPGVIGSAAAVRDTRPLVEQIGQLPIPYAFFSAGITDLVRLDGAWGVQHEAVVSTDQSISRDRARGKIIPVRAPGDSAGRHIGISGTGPLGRLGPEYSGVMAFIGHDQLGGSCFVEVSTQGRDLAEGIVSAALLNPGQSLDVRPLRSLEGMDFRSQYDARPTRHIGIAMALPIVGLFLLQMVARRSEHGLYQALSTDRSASNLTFFVESSTILLLSHAIVLGGLAVLHFTVIVSMSYTYTQSLTGHLAALALLGIACLVRPSGSIAELVRDR